MVENDEVPSGTLSRSGAAPAHSFMFLSDLAMPAAHGIGPARHSRHAGHTANEENRCDAADEQNDIITNSISVSPLLPAPLSLIMPAKVAADAPELAGSASVRANMRITGDVSGSVLRENGVVLYNWNPSTQLQHWIAAETAVASGVAGAQARIITFGDSTTAGVGAGTGQSYPDDLVNALGQDSSIPTEHANFTGDNADTAAVSFIGGGAYNYGLNGAGGALAQLSAPGQGIVWTPIDTGTFNRLDISYWDQGNGSIVVTATGGPQGSFSETLQLGNSGNLALQTIDLPEGAYTQVSVVSDTGNPAYIEGASLWDFNTPSIQVINAGVGGSWSSAVGTGEAGGLGQFQGGLADKPSLALLDYGINDIDNDVFTAAQTVANFALMVTECRASNCDPIIVIPEPFLLDPDLPNDLSSIAAVTQGLEALSVQMNVPIIDLNATYGSSPTTYADSSLIGFGVHPGAAGYADIAARIAAVLTDSAQNYSNSAEYVVDSPVTVTGTPGNDVLFSTGTTNTLIGSGGNDSYIMNASDQTDIVVNGTAGGTQAVGQLQVMAGDHQQLWLSVSGADLVVQILGTMHETIIKNWATGGSAQLQQIVANDGSILAGTNVQSLVAAMASFSAANAGFDPVTTPYTTLADIFYASLTSTDAVAWGGSGGGNPSPPAPPGTPMLAAGSDSGVLGDGITNISEPMVTGTATAGDAVQLYDGTVLIGTAIADGSGTWTIAAGQPLAEGIHRLLATESDAAGDVSAFSGTLALTIDTQPPSTPYGLALANGDGTPGQTQSIEPIITGTADPGTSVSLFNDGSLVGTQVAGTNGVWSIAPATPLALGAQDFTASAMDAAGNVSTLSGGLPVSIVAPAGGQDSLVLSVGEVAAGGENAQFTVSVDGTQIGGVQTVTAAQAAGGGQTISLAGSFGAAGPHDVAITYLDGFAGNPADAGRLLFINAVSLDGLATFPDAKLLFDSTSSYTASKPATPLASNAGSHDSLVLNLSETQVGGQDAMFMVSVDGQLVGGIQSVTASHALGQSQNVTLTGDFGTGPHQVAIDFLNGFAGDPNDAGRTLYVNALSFDGQITQENASQFYIGPASYTT